MFRKTVVARALTLAFCGAAITVGAMAPAMAQSNATGTIFGTVTPGANVKVTIENPATGLRRTLTPDAQGRFQATALPTGTYQVTQLNGTTVVGTAVVDASVGQGAEAIFAPAESVQTVQVTGRRRAIDVSSTNNGATFNARQLAALPIARSVEAIIQLAPSTTRADSRFAGGASFGGGAASENSYYINGFPVVNPLTGLGASQLPFGAIAEAQVLTGGFGAEFGRSIGGVVNVITKSGSNNWEVGGIVTYEPESWRAKPKDIFYAKTGAATNAATDGTLRLARAENTQQRKVYGAYVGGPIIQDKLFFFVSGEQTKVSEGVVNGFSSASSATNARNGWRDRGTNIDRYMVKIDWNIADNHRLEYTALGDTPTVTVNDSGFNYATRARVGVVTSSASRVNVDNNGGETKMLKYTGNLTDAMVVTALYGKTKSDHKNIFPGYVPDLFQVLAPIANQVPGVTYNNPQGIAGNILAPGSVDNVESARLDLEYRLGNHTLRGGIDKTKVESLRAGDSRAGGGFWTYFKQANPNESIDEVAGFTVPSPASGGGYGTQGYYVTRDLFSSVTDSYGEQSAFYLEDKFQVTKNLLLTLGVRSESFKNQNDAKATFLEMKNQINPRFAAAWDVFGDASMKVFGTAGRYSVPIPTHISVRGAGRSLFTAQYFTYSGVNANGQPTGLVQLSPPLSNNNEYNQDKVVATLSALDMKPSYQDEMTVGFEKAFSPSLTFGAKATYRMLKQTIDDFCDVRPFETYAAANKIAITNPLWGNTCQTFNPGQDNSFLVDFSGDATRLTKVSLSAQAQGFPKPKRTYAAVDVFAEHPFRDGWYGKVNYTWSRNKGNTEGQVRSDNGQADVAVTSAWDYPELMIGADGLLPNDRTHQIKAFGFMEVTKEVMVGANVLIASGRPRSCIGSEARPDLSHSPNYSNQTFWCLGATRAANVITPRGTLGHLPWDNRLDMNVAYKPSVVPGMQLRLDVFNVLNRQVVQNVTEAYNSGSNVSGLYQTPLSLTAPRSGRISVSYDRKF